MKSFVMEQEKSWNKEKEKKSFNVCVLMVDEVYSKTDIDCKRQCFNSCTACRKLKSEKNNKNVFFYKIILFCKVSITSPMGLSRFAKILGDTTL